ncbi:DUF937 domain-containing protein [Kumtagia ephedrae]|jgi:hypothetical protein|uniref:DUF937 domain-containing protein n=1 Tax=Kumtagia ephedrae TaxID=2116701 RepID=A0A2P7S4X3_9HYPH|nr:DUF937 domain-containing protein [Mesorhizobium ephedrae]PSJ57530.1 hypothetical protein C7I84_17985 [Mesorhizobium ephedrae]
MPTLFDMMAQNGQGMDQLARQFGLSQQQAQSAVEALMPAFSQGLKRNTADPYGVAGFMTALASGQHAKYFEDAQNAFSPQGVAEGNGILGHLFGSKDLSRAVAGQAAQATGIGQDVLKQMLPVIASMIMGGLFKQSTGQAAQAGGFGGGGNPLGEIIEQMMRQGGGMGGGQPQQRQQAPDPASPADNPLGKILQDMFGGGAGQQVPSQPQQRGPAPANPLDNPLGKVLQDMFGGGAGQAPSQPQQPPSRPRQAPPQPQQAPGPFGDNPWGKILEEMMRGGQAQQMPQAEPEPQPAPRQRAPEQRANPSGRQRNPYDDLFGDMFDTGAKQRDDYQKGVESIFEQFTKGMDRYR